MVLSVKYVLYAYGENRATVCTVVTFVHNFWLSFSLSREGPFYQLEIMSHLGQPSCFHCEEINFQSFMYWLCNAASSSP